MRFTIASNTSIIPMPSLALANMACDESSPITSSIWRKTSSGRAPGRSILFITGMISNPCSTARYALAKV